MEPEKLFTVKTGRGMLFFILFMLCGKFLCAQEKVIAGTIMENPTCVSVKWFTGNLLKYEAYKVYRKEGGRDEFILLTGAHLNKGDIKPTPAEYYADSTLASYIKFADALNNQNFTGFAKISVFIKAVLSNSFARYLGMMYDDTTCIKGTVYIYKVTGIKNGQEAIIGLSDEITAGKPCEIIFPKEINVSHEDKTVNLSWLPEEQKYFGVNIFRSVNNGKFVKINLLPVIVSKTKDEEGKLSYPQVFYSDTAVGNVSGRICYRLVCVDFFGNSYDFPDDEYAGSSDKCIEIDRADRPSGKIEITSVSYGHLTAVISWASSADSVLSYEVLVSNDGKSWNPVKASEAGAHLCTDTIVFKKPGRYYFKIRAGERGGEKTCSFPEILDVRDTRAPGAPGEINVKTKNGTIALSWKKPAENDVAGYHVYRGTKEMKKLIRQTVVPVKECHFTDSLRSGLRTAMVYSVSAVDSSQNESKWSDTVVIRLQDKIPPPVPTLTLVRAKQNEVVISWKKDATGQTSGYFVKRTEEGKRDKVLNKNPVGAGETTITDKTVISGKKYGYSIYAVDGAGNESAFSTEWKVTISPDGGRSGKKGR